MGNETPRGSRVVTFYVLCRLPEDFFESVSRPVYCGFHAIDDIPGLRYLIFVQVRLSDNSSLQEILWNFSRIMDEEKRLTLSDNPHFYTILPTSPDAYGDSLRIDPTEDFQYEKRFYVLTDRPELVHIKTDQVSRSFGNFWCQKDSVIFKGSNVLFLF